MCIPLPQTLGDFGFHQRVRVCQRPARWRSRDKAALPGRAAFVGAGNMERAFHSNARAIAGRLRTHGAAVSEVYVPSGHGMNTWVNIWNAAIAGLGRQMGEAGAP